MSDNNENLLGAGRSTGDPGNGGWAAQGQGRPKTRGHWAGQVNVPISSPQAFSYISKAAEKSASSLERPTEGR